MRQDAPEEAPVERDQLTDEAAAEVDGELLPPREAMSLIMPGATADTAAADSMPIEAQQWHGNPDDPHIM